jgi:TP901 family phage tail tape measure protein
VASQSQNVSIVLGAVISKTFGNVLGKATKDVGKIGDALQRISKQKVSIEGVQRIEADLERARARLNGAQQSVMALRKEMAEAGDSAKEKLAPKLAAAQEKAERLANAVEKERNALAKANTEMRESGVVAGNNATQITKLGAAYDKLIDKQQKQQKLETLRGDFNRKLGDAAVSTAAVGGVFASVIIPASKFEDAMLGVAKQVTGAKDAAGNLTPLYYEMGAAIQDMGTKIPMPTNEIAKLVEQAARMGIQGKENLLMFAMEAAKMSTAFDIPAEQIGDQMGKILGIFKLPTAAIRDLGDSINYLDDNAISKGTDIIEVMQRMGGSANTVGLAAPNVAALASTFLSLGESAERAGTAGEGMIRQLSIAEMNPEKFQEGARMIGMSAKELQKGMTIDAQNTILKVLTGIKKLDPEKQMEAVTRLFGKDWGGAIAKVANNLDEYNRQIDLANGKGKVGSMDKEFEQRQRTTSAHWEKFKNSIGTVAVNIGAVLLPVLNKFMDYLIPITANMGKWVTENKGFVTGLVTVGSTLMGLFAGAKVFGVIATGIRLIGAAFIANPIGLLIAGIVTAGVLLYQNWDVIKAKALELGAAIKNIWTNIKGAVVDGIKTFIDFHVRMYEVGSYLVDGLKNGMLAKWGQFKNWVGEIAGEIVGKFKSVLGIKSPSRVFMQLGGYVAEGAALGMQGKSSNVLKAAGALGTAAVVGFGSPAMAGTTPGANYVPTYAKSQAIYSGVAGNNQQNFYISQMPGEDAEALARRVAELVKQQDRTTARRTMADVDFS